MADTAQVDQNTSPATDKIHDEYTAGLTETIKVAVVHNNLAAVERILETSPVVPEARFDYTLPGDKNITRGLDPLMLAAALGRLRITKLLLMKGSDFFAETDGGLNSFFLATSRGNVEVAQIILQEGGATLLESRNKKGETPLLAATRNGAVNTITFLIERGANMTARNRDYDTAIHIASRSGHFDVVQMIYDAIGTNMLELEGHRLQTPLLAAAANSKFEIIKFLLRKGASIMARDLFDNTVLHLASMSKSIDLVERLLKYEPSLLDEQNTRGKSALLIAAEKGDFDIVKFLLGEGADIMTRDRSRRTALHVATMNKSIEIVKLLLKREPNLLDLHDMFEQTALLIAAEKGHVEIIRHLHSRGAEIEAADSTGVTALLAAACFGHFPVVKYLIEAGADPTKTTSHGMNALHLITCFSHSAEVIDILLDGPANILKTAIAAKDDSGDTPLCYAISRNHAPTIWKLLESKVYFPLSPAQDEVHLSPYPESDKVYEWLLKWLEVDDEQGEIVEAVESLVDEHSETSVDKEFYHTKSHTNGIIYWALLNNREKLIELAMKKGQNPTFNQEGDRKGVTWLHVAALGGHVGLLEHLPDWQDDILAEANKKTTPLHLAAKQGNYDMVWKLLESLEGESLRTKASSTTGRQRMLQAITEGTDEEETLISLAAARKDSREHARLERSLWDKLFTIIENDEEFFELPHSDEAELIMGVAAWRHTTGEKEHLFRIMDLIHRGGECRHFHQSPLQFIVCHKFPVALWWLLSSGGYSGENHIREGELMMKTWEQQPGTEDSVHRLIEELLRNPPPVRPSLRDDNRPPRFQFERPNSDSQKGTVLNLFVTTKRQIIFELKRASMIDVIYDKGPEEIMATDGYGHFQAFKKRLTYLKQDQNNQQSKPEGPDEELRQKIVEEKPCNVVTGPEGESKKGPGEEDTFEPVSRERKSRFRWIHIPVNNLRYVEELMVRISQEKKRDNGYHRHLADFMQKSRSELPAGGRNHYMKPDCQSCIIAQDASSSSETIKSKSNLPAGNTRVFALYMPYLFWGQEPRDTNIEDSSNEESLHLKTSLQESQNAYYENITSNMYSMDGDTKLRPISPIQNQITRVSTFDLYTSTARNHRKASDRIERREIYPINDRHISIKNCVHKSITLDQYYYVSLQDTESRDHDQVLVRYFDRLRERLGAEKEKAAEEKRAITKTKRWEQNSMQIPVFQLDQQGEGSPHTRIIAHVKPTQILVINQLWVWILDSDTIITSTTEEPDDVTDTFLQRVLNNLQAQNGKTVSSITDVAEYIIATATSLFNAQDIEIDNSDDGKRSPLEIFRESIQHVRDEETRLFREFRLSLVSSKQDKFSTNNNTSRTHNRPEKWWRQLGPENPYEDISIETRLLDEVKDILDELNILKNLAIDQKAVYERWKSVSGMEDYRHLGPSETKEDIEDMIEDAKSVQSAINTLLDLKQKEATIVEAQAARRQSDAVMVFTTVTIIFLPASFLTSMFALNVTNFPHEDGTLTYRGRWIFPIIFGISVPVSIIFMIIAFNANRIKSIWRAWTRTYRSQLKPEVQKSKIQAGEGTTVLRRIMGPGNDGNV